MSGGEWEKVGPRDAGCIVFQRSGKARISKLQIIFSIFFLLFFLLFLYLFSVCVFAWWLEMLLPHAYSHCVTVQRCSTFPGDLLSLGHMYESLGLRACRFHVCLAEPYWAGRFHIYSQFTLTSAPPMALWFLTDFQLVGDWQTTTQ